MALDLSVLDQDIDFRSPEARGCALRAPLSSFEEDPDNPRFEAMPEEFEALVENVREHGILQPIVVRRLQNGRLRICFGARRYRAAVQLALADAPYVVTEDPRHLDDYTQVAENERRTPMQPLELGTFIAKKLALGESKSSVAAKLGMHASSVMYLLSLAEAPPFVLELYHSRRCRSSQYLYRLTKLWKIDAGLVEKSCAAASEVGLPLIETIEAALQRTEVVGAEVGARAETSISPASTNSTSKTPPSTSTRRGVPNQAGARTRHESGSEMREDERAIQPQLFGTVDGKEVEVLIFSRPTSETRAVVRYTNELIESEVDLARIALTRLVHHSER